MFPRSRSEDRARVDDEEVLEPPGVRHVLVPGEDEVARRRAAGTRARRRRRRRVALAAGAGHRQQVVVEHEDAQVGGLGELLLDPAVAAAADLPVVEIGLGRVDGDDRDAVLSAARSCARRRAPRSGRSRRCASRGCRGSRPAARTRCRSR